MSLNHSYVLLPYQIRKKKKAGLAYKILSKHDISDSAHM